MNAMARLRVKKIVACLNFLGHGPNEAWAKLPLIHVPGRRVTSLRHGGQHALLRREALCKVFNRQTANTSSQGSSPGGSRRRACCRTICSTSETLLRVHGACNSAAGMQMRLPPYSGCTNADDHLNSRAWSIYDSLRVPLQSQSWLRGPHSPPFPDPRRVAAEPGAWPRGWSSRPLANAMRRSAVYSFL
jgi:hypothetical protein